jgi:hypothetical protein
LPETAYERLVGRDAELQRLDEAWADAKTNILSLVAEGGAGKSALVNEWLKRLQADNYRGAEAVLGWSFYSQGSKERATAADQFLNWALDKLGITLATTSASAKAEAIAEAMMRRRVLLLLDGVEPLQHGPGPQFGQLKDLGLRALLRRFAATPPGAAHGLVVFTSRLAVKTSRAGRMAPRGRRCRAASDEAARRSCAIMASGAPTRRKPQRTTSAAIRSRSACSRASSRRRRPATCAGRPHPRLFRRRDNPRQLHARRVMESYEKSGSRESPCCSQSCT